MNFYQINLVAMERRHTNIKNLSVNADVAKLVSMEGGISIFIALSRSHNGWVAEEATGDCQTCL